MDGYDDYNVQPQSYERQPAYKPSRPSYGYKPRERIYIQNLNLNDLENKQKIKSGNEQANSNWNSNDVYDLISKKEKIERPVYNSYY